MDYSCGGCGRTIVKAEGTVPVRMTARCPRCREISELRALDDRELLHATYRCTNEGCGRTQHVERPVAERRYCIACGTESLERVAGTPRRRTQGREQQKAPSKVRS